ncbi:unnamed protein product [Cercopithifilaria johnstoni]|uniref:Uncharacterized protein n=1 Tax=Cercopithifilaria johnstoni TaxID=2874296 RepID=A0A8J2M2N7_9BILA|nr:unnamed protein product [Cercopithifilaria johnstoni]
MNYKLCAYTSDEKLLTYASRNAEVWVTDRYIRSFMEAVLFDFKANTFAPISGRPWMYHKYIYSKPTVDSFTGYVTPSKYNIPLHLCAVGSYNLTIGNWNKEDFTMKIGKREVLAEPEAFCYFIVSLEFKETDRKPPTSLEIKYGSDTEELCKDEGCKIEAPICLQDLISTDHVIATFRCCCNEDDLCNHFGNKYFEETNQLISST